jgi:hypothetical protein
MKYVGKVTSNNEGMPSVKMPLFRYEYSLTSSPVGHRKALVSYFFSKERYDLSSRHFNIEVQHKRILLPAYR